jgi:hypothetical protein
MKRNSMCSGLRRGTSWYGRDTWPAISIVLLFSVALTVLAQAPGWWTDRAVLDPSSTANDFASANQGQIKWLATQAAAEFDDKLLDLGGAGTNIAAMLATFSPSNNFLLVNVGQLKATAKPFYDRLAELSSVEPYVSNALPSSLTGPYPWTTTATDDVDYAVANVGQAKFVFSMDFDRDGDGLPDWWEWHYFANLNQNASGSFMGDGWSNLQKYHLGLNPLVTIANGWILIVSPPDGSVVGGFE